MGIVGPTLADGARITYGDFPSCVTAVKHDVGQHHDNGTDDQRPLGNVPIDQPVEIVHDEAALVARLARGSTQPLLKQGQRTVPVEDLH